MTLEGYTEAIARKVVAQIMAQMEVEKAQGSGLGCLADVLLRYLTELGKASGAYATVAGRSEGNLSDVLAALPELGTSIAEVRRYALQAVEEPFSQPLPAYPVRKKQRAQPTFRSTKKEAGEEHVPPPSVPVPDYFPILPRPHTYRSTPTYDPARKAQRTIVLEQAATKKHAERALVRLEGATVAALEREQRKAEDGVDADLIKGNPLLAASGDADGGRGREVAAFALATQQIESLLEQASGAAAKGAAGDGGRQRQGQRAGDAAGPSQDEKRPAPLPAGGVPAVAFTPLWDSRLGRRPASALRAAAAGGGSAQVFDGEDEERHTRILGEEAENMVKDAKAVMQAGREQRFVRDRTTT